jgi:membrane protease YdiL (CAAX protease family)
MSIRIHYLDLLIVMSCVFPAGVVLRDYSDARSDTFGQRALAHSAVLAVLIVSSVCLEPALLDGIQLPSGPMCLAALFAIPFSAAVETSVAAWYVGDHIVASLGGIIRRLRGRVDFLPVILLVSIGVEEEFVFRHIFITVFQQISVTWPFLAIGLSALLYGLNHLWFGNIAVLTKFFSGLVFGFLYWISDDNFLVPAMTHAGFNILAAMSRR